ncbi:putative amidophosphoribosyltransferase [Saccharopolyspora lacisalsi]|uniref:Putative amidophosphoribosyltransferase n=1 Tax=Halosaccharopolyspora lacisalsi TaxID=1000566 RepID=A0A839E0T9_9PSEU|nr:putative amidophosphoribosyltransferase [Halosaccharopolyspora lacisalsi]
MRRVRRPFLDPAPAVYALGYYRGPARRAVLAYKESGQRGLATPFGERLATGLAVLSKERPDLLAVGDHCCLVPAPSRASASRQRGGAHMVRVGERAVAALAAAGWSCSLADCLVLARGARDSVGLTPAERTRNLAGRVRLRSGRLPSARSSLVLIDDVITTGATATSCLRALETAELRVTAVLGLTATSR